MSKSVTASFAELMRQSRLVTREQYDAAIEYLDAKFGTGYAKNNPTAVATFVQSYNADFATTVFLKVIEDLTEQIDSSSERISRAMTNMQVDLTSDILNIRQTGV